jgi:hypothetical protein
MYGAYIKGRGWIKTYDAKKKKIICCRNAGDIYKEFIFKNKTFLAEVQKKYPKGFEELEFEYRRITKDQRIDKRVVPHKKGYYYTDNFKLNSCKDGYYYSYCKWCNLFMDNREYESNGICVHCMKELYDTLNKVYRPLDKEIKRSWERAKILDEI